MIRLGAVRFYGRYCRSFQFGIPEPFNRLINSLQDAVALVYSRQISWQSNKVNRVRVRVRLCMFIYSILPNTVNNARNSYNLSHYV